MISRAHNFAPIIVALDDVTVFRAGEIIDRIRQRYPRTIFKVNDLFHDPEFPQLLKRFPDVPWFIDLKLHDIPNTVLNTVRRLRATIKPTMLTVHASGGEQMVRQAVMAGTPVQPEYADAVRILAVTALTSLSSDDTRLIYGADTDQVVTKLAAAAYRADVWGVVCSYAELQHIPEPLLSIVPGIRPAWYKPAKQDDQKRATTPAEAIAAGADFIVIGRPITQHGDPAEAMRMTADEIGYQPLLDLAHSCGALRTGSTWTLKSGRESPYFFNAAAFESARNLEELGRAIATTAKDHFFKTGITLDQRPNVIAGPAYKGHALAIATSAALWAEGINTSAILERKEAKTHGDRAGMWVGRSPQKGDRVLVVDDVITDGRTKRDFITAIRDSGAEIVGVVVVLDRGERDEESPNRTAAAALQSLVNVPVVPVITMQTLLPWLRREWPDRAAQLEDYLRTWGPK